MDVAETTGSIPFQLQFDKPIPFQVKMAEWNPEVYYMDLLILSGDHLYRMDYMDFIQNHRQSGADITIARLPMDDSQLMIWISTINVLF